MTRPEDVNEKKKKVEIYDHKERMSKDRSICHIFDLSLGTREEDCLIGRNLEGWHIKGRYLW